MSIIVEEQELSSRPCHNVAVTYTDDKQQREVIICINDD